jgi:hypothetical protein
MTTPDAIAILATVAIAYLVGLIHGNRAGRGRASRRYARALSGRGRHPGRTLVLIGVLIAAAYLYVH